MKKILTLILMCFYGQLTISQHLVEFGIININNNEPIEGAYIEILGIGDTKTDEFGKAIFEEVEEGRISVVIRKKGYLSITKSDINISRPNSLNTNNWIIELSPSSKNVISIIGKVENENEKLLDSVEIYLRLGANYESITKSDKFGNFKFTIEDFGEIGNLYELTFIKVGYEDRYMTGEIFNKKLWFKKSIKLIRKEIIEVHATSDKYLELFNLGYNLYILGFIESSGVEDTPNYDKAIEELDTKIEKAINLLKLKRSYPKNSPEEYKDFKEQLSEDKDKKILEIGLSTAALEAIIMAFPKLPNNFQEKGFESFNEAKGELEYNLIQYNFNNSLDLLPVIKKRKSKFIITGEMSKFIAKFKGEIREKYK